MASAMGLPCKVDPVLVQALGGNKGDHGEEEYQLACLLMVFVAVSIPKLARNEGCFYKPNLDAHANNSHCLAEAINGIAGALFSITGQDVVERLKEFLALLSSGLLRVGEEPNRESVYLLLEMIVKQSPFLSMDLLESCFSYCRLSNSYSHCFRSNLSE